MSHTCTTTVNTGFGGVVVCDDVRLARITNWSLVLRTTPIQWSDSASAGFQWSTRSAKSGSGTFSFNVDEILPQFDTVIEGRMCRLDLWHELLVWQLQALVTSMSLTVDVAAGGVPTVGTAEYVANRWTIGPNENETRRVHPSLVLGANQETFFLLDDVVKPANPGTKVPLKPIQQV